MIKKELDKVLSLHLKWLSNKPDGVCADLSGADLSDSNLSYANLNGAYLKDSNLSGADLSGAYLSGADLRGAGLIGANLSGANLSDSNLSGANLSDSNLRDAYLICADLSDANLSGADLIYANLSGADLRGAKIDYQIQENLLDEIKQVLKENPDKLAMAVWHSDCGTSHCLAGWACHLNEKAKELEESLGPAIAGLLTLGPEAYNYFYKSNKEVKEWLGI